MSSQALAALRRSFEDSRPQGQTLRRNPLRVEQVASPSAQNRRLQDLHDRVVASLANSGYPALLLIGCDIDPNRVILRGSVPTYHLKQLAQVYAQRVEGVGRIDNRLEVRRR